MSDHKRCQMFRLSSKQRVHISAIYDGSGVPSSCRQAAAGAHPGTPKRMQLPASLLALQIAAAEQLALLHLEQRGVLASVLHNDYRRSLLGRPHGLRAIFFAAPVERVGEAAVRRPEISIPLPVRQLIRCHVAGDLHADGFLTPASGFRISKHSCHFGNDDPHT